MCTNHNLKSSVKPFLIALIASISIFCFAFFTESKGLNRKTNSNILSEFISSEGEDFTVSGEGFVSTNYSPNYYQPQVSGNDNPHQEKIEKVMNVELTGYSSTVDQTNSQPFITASGYRVEDGIVAANFLKFGTKIRIPEYFGDKVFTVRDRMNSRYSIPKNSSYQGYVDIWFSTRQEARNFGRVKAEIEILE